MSTAGRGTWFSRLAKALARQSGRPISFILVVAAILLWAISGPIFGYSDTWQLIINTTSSIITLLMVFLIQNTQNRDTTALQVKMDELIRAIDGAHNELLDLEDVDDEDLERIQAMYQRLAGKARKDLKRGLDDTGIPVFKLKRKPADAQPPEVTG